MPSAQTEQTRASQTEDVYERLRSALMAAQYLPGQKLKITELCRDVQGSLGAVREALSRLLAEGLVESEPYKGFHVAPVSPAEFIQLTKARIEVEKLCLSCSLERGDIEWEGRLVALLHQLSRYGGLSSAEAVDEWSRLHAAFHEMLVSKCANVWLLRMRRLLHDQSERYRRLALMVGEGFKEAPLDRPRRDTPAEHRALVDAALVRDVEGIGVLIAVHIQRTTDDLLNRLEFGALTELTSQAGLSPAIAIEIRSRLPLRRA